MFKHGLKSAYLHSVKWGGYGIGISFIRQILLVPAFILSVGNAGYALWLVLLTIVLLVNALSVGFLHYSSNLVSLSYHRQDSLAPVFNDIYSTSWLLIAVKALLGIVLSITPVLAFCTNFSVDFLNEAHASWALLLLLAGKLVFLYNSSFFVRLFEPLGNIKLTLKLQTLGEALDLAVTAGAILLTKSVFLTCLCVASVNAVYAITAMLYVRRKVAYIRVSLQFSFSNGIAYFKASSVLNLSFFIEKVYDAGLNLFVTNSFGALALPVFTTSRTMINVFYRLCYTIIVPLFPSIQKHFALSEMERVYQVMRRYWAVSVSLIIICVTIGLPVVPYIYTWWTKNRLEYNGHIVALLLIAILFQNFAVIITEFFKRTNFAKQLLLYNTIKCSITVLAILVFGSIAFYDGLGLALALGEAAGVALVVSIFRSRFSRQSALLMPLLQIGLFCVAVFTYLQMDSYLPFVIINMLALALNAWYYVRLKNK